MEGLKIYSQGDVLALVNKREGEIKIGERVQVTSSLEALQNCTAKFVIVGIPEDIGVRANYGFGGASTAWETAIKALLNVQNNQFLQGENLLVLGHFIFNEPKDLSIAGLSQKVCEIDNHVYPVIEKIVAAGKIPVVIGGGHNNAYPIVKGTSLAQKKGIDVINIDAHADLRPPEGRHSGNGFTYAVNEGFLKHYGIYGLHENYNNQAILTKIQENENIEGLFFDEIIKEQDPCRVWDDFINHFDRNTGLEIDLDSIENVLSSASSPSGFELNYIRKLLCTSSRPFSYLHICEGAISLTDGRKDVKTAKTIAYLITDFIKGQLKMLL